MEQTIIFETCQYIAPPKETKTKYSKNNNLPKHKPKPEKKDRTLVIRYNENLSVHKRYYKFEIRYHDWSGIFSNPMPVLLQILEDQCELVIDESEGNTRTLLLDSEGMEILDERSPLYKADLTLKTVPKG